MKKVLNLALALVMVAIFLLTSCALDEVPLVSSTPAEDNSDKEPLADVTPDDSQTPQEDVYDEYTPLDKDDLIQAFKDLTLNARDELSIIFQALGRVPDSGTDLYNNYRYESTDGSAVLVRSVDSRTIQTARFHDAHMGNIFDLITPTSWMDFPDYIPLEKSELIQAFKNLNLHYGDDVRIIFQALGTVPNTGSGMSYYHYECTDGTYVLVTAGGRTIIDVRLMCRDEGFAFVDMMELMRTDATDATE
jgi:hypothetical protein